MKFERDDGTGRPPRSKLQEQALAWIESHFTMDGPGVIAAQLPTGLGKSWLARVIQRATGGQIIVPSNILMDETYISAYPEVNFLKGKSHYSCGKHGVSCQDVKAVLKQTSCVECPYSKARHKAAKGAPTFFNPMSLFYLQNDERYTKPDVIIVDEAHQLNDMLLMLSGRQFRKGKYNFPDTTSEVEIMLWMHDQVEKLSRLLEKRLVDKDLDAAKEIMKELGTLSNTLKGLEEDSQNYCIWVSEGPYRGKTDKFLNVVPLKPPRYLVDTLLDCKKLVLMSATLSHVDIQSLLGTSRPYAYLDSDSPIPKENRTVCYAPMPFKVNYQTPPASIAAHIDRVLAKYPGVNTIIHVSYGLAERLKPHLKTPMITHTSIDKQHALEKFKAEGGVFLASGFAEGIDLKGDLCGLNIIPVINKLNPYDPAVKKRMALPDGQRWYDLEQIKTLVQQVGRSTRNETDKSTVVVCDPSFPRLILNNKKDLPKSFNEAIDWRRKVL